MKRIRVIPVLLVRDNGLYKTIRFKSPNYVGDPINAVKIFNEKEVDELVVLDINASFQRREPNYKLIGELASECFMPLAYGGGVNSIDVAKKVFDIGVEKIILNTAFLKNPLLIREIAALYGSQSVVVSIDVKSNFFSKQKVYTCERKMTKLFPIEAAKMAQEYGAGEIILNSVDNDGLRCGYDLKLISQVSASVKIPVVACGGANNIQDFLSAVKAGASAVAAGSMFVYQRGINSVLINYPSQNDLSQKLYSHV